MKINLYLTSHYNYFVSIQYSMKPMFFQVTIIIILSVLAISKKKKKTGYSLKLL